MTGPVDETPHLCLLDSPRNPNRKLKRPAAPSAFQGTETSADASQIDDRIANLNRNCMQNVGNILASRIVKSTTSLADSSVLSSDKFSSSTSGTGGDKSCDSSVNTDEKECSKGGTYLANRDPAEAGNKSIVVAQPKAKHVQPETPRKRDTGTFACSVKKIPTTPMKDKRGTMDRRNGEVTPKHIIVKIKRSPVTDALAKARNALFGKPSARSPHVDTKTPLSNPKVDAPGPGLRSPSPEESISEYASFSEFAHDLKFLSRCSNMMSSPDQRRQKTTSVSPEGRPPYRDDDVDLLLPPPESITKAMFSICNHRRTPLAISPLAVSKHRPEIDVENRSTRLGHRSLTSWRLNASNSRVAIPESPDYVTPVRRSLSFSKSSPPLVSQTDVSRNQFSDSVTSPDREPVKIFANETEAAVYYLITKYLQKDDEHYEIPLTNPP